MVGGNRLCESVVNRGNQGGGDGLEGSGDLLQHGGGELVRGALLRLQVEQDDGAQQAGVEHGLLVDDGGQGLVDVGGERPGLAGERDGLDEGQVGAGLGDGRAVVDVDEELGAGDEDLQAVADAGEAAFEARHDGVEVGRVVGDGLHGSSNGGSVGGDEGDEGRCEEEEVLELHVGRFVAGGEGCTVVSENAERNNICIYIHRYGGICMDVCNRCIYIGWFTTHYKEAEVLSTSSY